MQRFTVSLQEQWQWLSRLLLVVVFTLSAVTPVAAQTDSLQVHPALLTLAEENPNEIVRIIVQQKAQERISTQVLARSGGQVTRTLPIINSIAMEIPARAVVQLARARGVRWITVDAPVIPAATPGNSCNLVKNAGFENGLADWSEWGDGVRVILSGQASTGAFAAQLSTAAGSVTQNIPNPIAGATYRVSGVTQLTGNSWGTLGIDFYNSNWTEIGEAYVSVPPSTNYRAVEASGVAPAGTTYMSVWAWKPDGSVMVVDDISVQNVSPSNECNDYAPGNSVSVLANGTFEHGTAQWSNSNSSLTITNNAYQGSNAIALGANSGGISQSLAVATPGMTYMARGMFHRTPGTGWSGIGIDFFDANWHEIGERYEPIPESSGYVPVVVTGVAPAGTAHASVWIYKNSGGSLLIDNVDFTAGTVAAPYVAATGANHLWFEGPSPLDGSGVTVAVVDSGIANHEDLNNDKGKSRVVYSADLTSGSKNNKDKYGHGTHVAGIIAGNGAASDGIHRGIAPGANLINMRISDGKGMTYASDLIEGLQWIYDNRDPYNIRVVNVSLNSTVPESYHNSPINAAVELLWFSGITVVVSAGNNGVGNEAVPLFAPANDPFVITVGATDHHGTATVADDSVATFSAYGTTIEGYAKPDLVAPGRNIISLSAGNGATMTKEHPSHTVGTSYFRMSGTSMATPVVTGVVALLLQDEPDLTSDQIKYRLKATAAKNWSGYSTAKAGAGSVNAYAAVHGNTTENANTNIPVSQTLFTGDDPVAWDSVSWNSVSWNSVSWNSVSWNSVSWNSVSWNSVSWNSVTASSIWDDLAITAYSTDTKPETLHLPDPAAAAVSETNRLYLPLITR